MPVHLGDTQAELAAPILDIGSISCLGSHLGHLTTQVAVNVRHEMATSRPKLVTAHASGSSRFLRAQHGADPLDFNLTLAEGSMSVGGAYWSFMD